MQVFISYSSENERFAEELGNTLRGLFSGTLVVDMMRNIGYGTSWSKVIEERLEAADVLIALVTNLNRREFSYTGVEVGYFLAHIKHQPGGSTGAPRCVIPVCLTDEVPAVLAPLQGPSFKEFLSTIASFDLSKPAIELAHLVTIDDTDPVYLLLSALDSIDAPKGKLSDPRKEKLKESARDLYQTIIESILSQPVSEDLPKGKIVVHLPPMCWDIALADLQPEGVLPQTFHATPGVSRYKWSDFAKCLRIEEIADEWREALQALLRTVQTGRIEEADQLVSVTGEGDHLLARMFVSRSVAFYDGSRDIHVYLIRLLKDREFGDALTTSLWKGIGSCVRLRFVLLESSSGYTESLINAYLEQGIESVKEYARVLKTEMYALERLWRVAGLNDPKILVDIVGEEKAQSVAEMIRTYFQCRNDLIEKIGIVLSCDETSIVEGTKAWSASIEGFRRGVSRFNAELIVDMQDRLRNLVAQSAKDDLVVLQPIAN